MKQIQWFPGHMSKSLREIKEKLSLVDIVFILLDARLPLSSMNPEVLKMVKKKPVLILFNKMDLADHKKLNYWISYYERQGLSCLLINSANGKNVNQIYPKAKQVLERKFDRFAQKGIINQNIRAIIIGIPNVGKSTLINRLSQKKVTKVANKPGVTKTQQWIKIAKDLELLDTPGVLWPKFEDEKTAFNLAVSGAIKDDILPFEQVALYAVDFLVKNYPEQFSQHYQITLSDQRADEIVATLGGMRKHFLKGRELDLDRTYKMILTDLRNNQLGGVSFD